MRAYTKHLKFGVDFNLSVLAVSGTFLGATLSGVTEMYRIRARNQFANWNWLAVFSVYFVLVQISYGQSGATQPAPRDPAGHPDLSGYWQLRYDSRSVPAAELTEEGNAKLAQQKEHDLLAIRWCANIGMPFLMDDNGTLDIRQSPKVIGIVAKTVSSVRYLYTDGRSHPLADELDPTTNGNSVAHWEGDDLVVDTIGFSDRGITAIPGGGFRTPASHLTERFRLMQNGNMLSVKSTWDDPHVFTHSQSYEYRYYRIPKNEPPLQYYCAARDPERAKFLMPGK